MHPDVHLKRNISERGKKMGCLALLAIGPALACWSLVFFLFGGLALHLADEFYIQQDPAQASWRLAVGHALSDPDPLNTHAWYGLVAVVAGLALLAVLWLTLLFVGILFKCFARSAAHLTGSGFHTGRTLIQPHVSRPPPKDFSFPRASSHSDYYDPEVRLSDLEPFETSEETS